MASAITKERVSGLEGSFGKEKEHYHLKKIKARTMAAKTLWTFFNSSTGGGLSGCY